ncbi:MAG: SRPBCC domain-containing protein [Thermomicrobiales bacterium]|nr:SRPBCC domain-containing protein [Thermomicrobiales bacterium]MCA9881183.1 SRPBCC domain-containing protein [Thermomicrobiales bacterium]
MLTTQAVEREIVVAAPVERVWAVLTEPEHIGQWFGNRAELEPCVGGAGLLEFEGYGAFKISVVRFEPTSFFSYRWANKAGDEAVPGRSTLVEFTLEPAGSSTKLRVVESDFDLLPLTEAEREHEIAEHTRGWREELDELRVYAEQRARQGCFHDDAWR